MYLVPVSFLSQGQAYHSFLGAPLTLTSSSGTKIGAPLTQMAGQQNMIAVNPLQGLPLTTVVAAQDQRSRLVTGLDLSAGTLAVSSPVTLQQLQDLVQRQQEASKRSMHKNYKTELCRSFGETGACRYGDKCQFAHGAQELQNMARHPKFKTEFCKNFHQNGYCPYGTRCHFVHNEAEAAAPPSQPAPARLANVASSLPHIPMAPTLTIQPASMGQFSAPHGLNSAGESPVPSSAGTDSPTSHSPGFSTSSEDVFPDHHSAAAKFSMGRSSEVIVDASQRFEFPSPPKAHVDALATQGALKAPTEAPQPVAQMGHHRRLPVFTRLSSVHM